MKTTLIISLITLFAITSCGRSDETAAPSTINTSTIIVENLSAKETGNNTSYAVNSKAFINFYDGISYTRADALNNQSKIDFAYNFLSNKSRYFENMKSLFNRTHAIDNFSTLTNSTFIGADQFGIKVADFDNIKTSEDIETAFTKFNIKNLSDSGYISYNNDLLQSRLFAFVDKNGKNGFFKVDDYIANTPITEKAPLTLHIKIQK